MSIFSRNDKTESDTNQDIPQEERLTGKIYHLSDEGWGFISSPDIEFTRIFFHWTGLEGNTKKFTELEKGDKVEFTPIQVKDNETGKMRDRAIRIRVIN